MLTIQRLTGELFNLADYGIKTLDFRVNAPTQRYESEEIIGRDGILDIRVAYDSRKLQATFFIDTANANNEFAQMRSEIFRWFAGKELYYLADSNEPGKRWKVRSDDFSVEQITASNGKFVVNFISPTPYAESVSSTLNPSAVMQVKQENFNDPPVQYEFSTANFSIWNDGDVSVNPRQQDLTITFTGASTNLSIKNVTTGDEWALTGDTIAGDVIKLDGIRSTKNNVSVFGDTNRQLLTLARGRNNFEITGSTDFTISFDFRFYYL